MKDRIIFICSILNVLWTSAIKKGKDAIWKRIYFERVKSDLLYINPEIIGNIINLFY